MKEFNSFEKFSKHIEKIAAKYAEKEKIAMNFIGKLLQEEARYKIGHLQLGSGNFDNWADLAESTKLDKQRKGFVFNSEYNPLFRTGELRESIQYVVNYANKEVIFGSALDIAAYQEFGTMYIPPRSFIGLTLFKEKEEIQYILGSFLINWITDSRSALKRSIYGSV